ncbi:MAG: response regulator transcription factor [Thermomicrobiales bacterium]|nr:response regulator transcription factor [Thermomicrobiales bacterium]
MLAAVRNGDLPAARLAGLDNLQRLRERGSLEPIAGGIADTAAYAAAKREWETAALLLGAAASVRASQGATFTLPARASYDHAEQLSRRRLGDELFEEAWNRGGRMGAMESLDAAVRYLQESGRAGRASAGSSPLTDREQDVLRLLATGASNPEIAEELFISRGTVRTHVSSILGKLNVHTRTEAVSKAHREGWI